MTDVAVIDVGETMPIDEKAGSTPAPGKHVLHVVGPITDEVFSFLGPTIRALDLSGHVQSVIAVGAPKTEDNVRRLAGSSSVILLPNTSDRFLQSKALLKACLNEITVNKRDAIHAHGWIPCVACSLALRLSKTRIPIIYSPHGSRTLNATRLARFVAVSVVRLLVRNQQNVVIVNMPRETPSFRTWRSTEVVESPVDDAFLAIERRESRKPSIVTGGHAANVRSIEAFSQLAVLLSGKELGLAFRWLGLVDTRCRDRLNASHISVNAIEGQGDLADELSTAWIYVASWSTGGFPLFLVQAMAAGLPCVALDCEQHREIIEHGKTGFLCSTQLDMVAAVAVLIDSRQLRADIGNAAREAAKRRFRESDFATKLLAAYPSAYLPLR